MPQLGDVNVRITASHQQFMAAMGKVQSALDRTSAKLTSIGTSLSLGLSVPLALAAKSATQAASRFESSFTGIRKTVNATETQFKALEATMRQMAKVKPIDVNELNAIGEVAGQLGIHTQNLEGFVSVMADLGVTTNLTAEQAATSLARIANVMGVTQDQFSNMGSTIVELGNNFATTESEIVEMANRLAGSGKAVNLTADQVFGLSAALSSVGIEAQAGGSSISRALIKMSTAVKSGTKELGTFARVAGMTTDDFKKAFEQDAGKAVASFVTGLGKISKAGGNAFQVLEDLELSDIRLVQSFISLANAGDLVTRAMDSAGRGFRENTALADEARKRYATFESQLQLVMARINDVAITLGNVLMKAFLDNRKVLDGLIDSVESIVNGFANMDSASRNLILAIMGIAIAIGPVILAMGILIKFVSPFAILTAAIIGVGVAAILIWKNWEEVAPHLVAIWEGLKADAKDWLDSTFGSGTFSTIKKWVGVIVSIVVGMKNTLVGVFQFVGNTIGAVFAGIGALWEGDFDGIKTIFNEWISTGLIPFINTIMDMAERIVGAVWDALPDRWKTALGPLAGIVQAVWNKIREIFDVVPDPDFGEMGEKWEIDADAVMAKLIKLFMDGFNSMAKQAVAAFNAGWRGEKILESGTIMDMIGLTKFLNDMGEKVSKNLDKYAKWIGNFLELVGNLSITNLIGNGIRSITGLFTSEAEAAINTVEAKMDSTASRFKNFGATLKSEGLTESTEGSGGGGLLGDLDPFNRGISSAGQQNEVLGGSLGTVKQQFPIRQATEFELKLENITEDMRGLARMQEMFGRFEGVDLNKLAPRDASVIMADWRDMQVAITTLYADMEGTLSETNQRILDDTIIKWNKLSTELVGNSIVPDMWKDIDVVWTDGSDSLLDTTEESTNAINDVFKDAAEETKTNTFNLFDTIRGFLKDSVSETSKTLPALLNALDALENKFKDVELEVPGTDGIEQIAAAVEASMDQINQLEVPKFFTEMSDVAKDLGDDFDMIAAKAKVMGSSFDALGAEVSALEQALIKMKFAQEQGFILTDKQKEQMEGMEKLLKDRKATQARVKMWKDITGSIKNSMRESLTGVLRGTQSIQEAFANMATNIFASMNERFIQNGLDAITKNIEEMIIGGGQGSAGQGSGILESIFGGGGKKGGVGGTSVGGEGVVGAATGIIGAAGGEGEGLGGFIDGLSSVLDESLVGIDEVFGSSDGEGFLGGLGSIFSSEGGGFLDSISSIFGGEGGSGFLGGLTSLFGEGGSILQGISSIFGSGGGGGGFLGSIMGMFGGGGGAAGAVTGGGGGGIMSMFGGITSLFGFAKGGIMTPKGPAKLESFASGGVASSPTMAMFGEGRNNEAFVPLPDGRRIPVVGGGGGGQNISINISTPDVQGFRKSIGKVQSETALALSRAQQRNE